MTQNYQYFVCRQVNGQTHRGTHGYRLADSSIPARTLILLAYNDGLHFKMVKLPKIPRMFSRAFFSMSQLTLYQTIRTLHDPEESF